LNLIGIFGVVFVIGVYLLIIGVCVADYVITSKALFEISKRRNIERPWLSWIPFIKNIIIGNLAEDYDDKNGKKHSWRNVLFVLTAISVIGIFAFFFIVTVIAVVLGISGGIVNVILSIVLVITYIGYIFAAIAVMALNVLRAICIYKIYESTVPEKSLKYMVLSLVVPLGGAICLYKCKDKGYPEPTDYINIMEDNNAEEQ